MITALAPSPWQRYAPADAYIPITGPSSLYPRFGYWDSLSPQLSLGTVMSFMCPCKGMNGQRVSQVNSEKTCWFSCPCHQNMPTCWCAPHVPPVCGSNGKMLPVREALVIWTELVGKHSPQEETMRKSNKRLNNPKVGLESLGMGETYICTDCVLAWVYKWADQGCRSLVSFQTINSSRKVGFYWNRCSAVYKETTKLCRC